MLHWYGNYSVYDDVVKLHFLQPPAQALDELAAVVSDVERDDDEVVLIYLLGSILDRVTNETSLPINVITNSLIRIVALLNFLINRTSLVRGTALLKIAGIL